MLDLSEKYAISVRSKEQYKAAVDYFVSQGFEKTANLAGYYDRVKWVCIGYNGRICISDGTYVGAESLVRILPCRVSEVKKDYGKLISFGFINLKEGY